MQLAAQNKNYFDNENQIAYHINLVKSFSYQIAQWIQLTRMGPQNGGLSLNDPYVKELRIELQDEEFNFMEQMIRNSERPFNFYRLLCDNFQDMPIFLTSFYQRFVIKDLLVAKRLFKNSLQRSECAKGSYHMLCNIYIQLLLSGKNQKLQSIDDLRAKFTKLDERFGNFMSYDSEYHKTTQKLNQLANYLESNQNPVVLNSKKCLLVLQLPQYKSVPMLVNTNKIDLFRHKYMLMVLLKFSPFVKAIEFVYRRHGGELFEFY